jgi:hypothetical protein
MTQIVSPTIVMRPVEALIPYARNSRTHSPEQVAQLAASIREFGWTNPVLIDEVGSVIAGHGRLMAARQLGIVQAPCIVLAHLTEHQRRAYVIADNKLALNAGWDEEMLKVELEALTAEGIDLGLTGFGADEINLIFNGWQSDIDVLDKHGENTDGFNSVIKIKVDGEAEAMAREVITNALEKAGIDYEK